MKETKLVLDTEIGELEGLEEALNCVAAADTELVLEVIAVGGEEIRRLNREVRGVDRVTDVLSFPTMELVPGEVIDSDEHGEELDEEGRLLIGSVAVCIERAREQAEEYGHSFRRELNYLTVHGALHCLGYDHETEEEKKRMREKEEEIMARRGLLR